MYQQENIGFLANRPSTAQRKAIKRAELQADMQQHLATKQQQLPRRNSSSSNPQSYNVPVLQPPVQPTYVQPTYQSNVQCQPQPQYQQSYSPTPQTQYSTPLQPTNHNVQSHPYNNIDTQYDNIQQYTQPTNDLNTSAPYHTAQQQYNNSPSPQYQQPQYTQPPAQLSRPPSRTYSNDSTGTGLQIQRPNTAEVKRIKQAQYKQELQEQMNNNAASKPSRRSTPVIATQPSQYTYQQPQVPIQPPVQPAQSYTTYTTQPVNTVQPVIHRTEAGNLTMFNNRPSTAQRKHAMREQQKQDMADAVAAKQAVNASRRPSSSIQPPIQQYHPPIQSMYNIPNSAVQPPRQPTPTQQNYTSAAQLAREHAAALMAQQSIQTPVQSSFNYPTVDTTPQYSSDTYSTYQTQSPLRQQLSPTYAQQQQYVQPSQPVYNDPYAAMQPPIQQPYTDYNNMNNTYNSAQSVPTYSLSPTNASLQPIPSPHYTLPKSPSNKGLASNLNTMHNGINYTEQQLKTEKQRQYQAELAEQVRLKELARKAEQAKLDELEAKKEREIQQYQPIVKGGRKRIQSGANAYNSTQQYSNNSTVQSMNDSIIQQQQAQAVYDNNTTYDNNTDTTQYNDTNTTQLNTTTDPSERKYMSGLTGLRAGLTEEQQLKKEQQKHELQHALQQQIQSKAAAKRAEAERYKREQELELQQIEEYNAQQQAIKESKKPNTANGKAAGKMQHSPVQQSRSISNNSENETKLSANEQFRLDLEQQIEAKKQAKAADKQKQTELDHKYETQYTTQRPSSSKHNIDVMTSNTDLHTSIQQKTVLNRPPSHVELEQQYAELQQHNTTMNDELNHNSLLLELKKHADQTTHQLELITQKLNSSHIQPPVQPVVQPIYQQPTYTQPNYSIPQQQPVHIPSFAQLPNINVAESLEPLQYTSRLLPVESQSIRGSTQVSRGTLQTRDHHRPYTNSFKRNANTQLYQQHDEIPRLHTASVMHVPYDTRLDTAVPKPHTNNTQPQQILHVQTRPNTTDLLYNDGNIHQRKTSVHIPLSLAAFGVTHATINPTDMITQRDHAVELNQPEKSVSPKQIPKHTDGRKFSVLGASAAISTIQPIIPAVNKPVTVVTTDTTETEYADDEEFVNPTVDSSQTFQVMNALDAY